MLSFFTDRGRTVLCEGFPVEIAPEPGGGEDKTIHFPVEIAVIFL